MYLCVVYCSLECLLQCRYYRKVPDEPFVPSSLSERGRLWCVLLLLPLDSGGDRHCPPRARCKRAHSCRDRIPSENESSGRRDLANPNLNASLCAVGSGGASQQNILPLATAEEFLQLPEPVVELVRKVADGRVQQSDNREKGALDEVHCLTQ